MFLGMLNGLPIVNFDIKPVEYQTQPMYVCLMHTSTCILDYCLLYRELEVVRRTKSKKTLPGGTKKKPRVARIVVRC